MGRPGLSRHPKFLLLARTLGDENLARGVLEHGWEVAYEAGDDRLGNPDAVEAACRWRGERGVCFAALRDAGGAPGRAGFIEERDGVWCVHDLYDHAPDYVRKRAAREEQRRVKGRSLAAGRRTLTGQSPGSDQALTPPRAPAPTRAPAPKEEDLPRAPPAGSAPLVLEEQRQTRTRKPSRQQVLYSALVAHRAEVLGPDALPDEPWAIQRQNEALGGPILDCEPGLLLAALQRFLESEFAGRCNPPGPLGVFVKQWSRWVSDAMRSQHAGAQ